MEQSWNPGDDTRHAGKLDTRANGLAEYAILERRCVAPEENEGERWRTLRLPEETVFPVRSAEEVTLLPSSALRLVARRPLLPGVCHGYPAVASADVTLLEGQSDPLRTDLYRSIRRNDMPNKVSPYTPDTTDARLA